jgi:hypothetical protein
MADDITRLRELCARLVQSAEAAPGEAGALADAVAKLLDDASGEKAQARRTGRRAAPVLDPFEIYRDTPDALGARLAELDLEQLRDVVAHYGMDPRRLVMKWKTSTRVVEHIVETVQARNRKGDAFRASNRLEDLTDRQREILAAVVHAWEADSPGPAHQAFRVGSLPLDHPNWPGDVAKPRERGEFRPLAHGGWLAVDRTQGPAWVFSPSERAVDAFSGTRESLVETLREPDRRSGLILDSVVAAYRADPSEPLHLAVMDQADYVRHPAWPLPVDAARMHDFELLEDVGLVAISPRGRDYAIVPTKAGRDVVERPLEMLEQAVEAADSGDRRSRLERVADRLRSGEVAANAAGGTISGLIILALS